MDVGTEETVKNSPSLSVHETAESRAPRKELPIPSQTLFRSVPHKRMLCAVFSMLFACLHVAVVFWCLFSFFKKLIVLSPLQ